MKVTFYYFPRAEYKGDPAGITVSKKPNLPPGDFDITEYCWSDATLWFVDADKFTSGERQLAYEGAALAVVEHQAKE